MENRDWVNFAKGVAIMLVVLYHCSLFLDALDLAGSTTRLRSFLSFYPMPLFFFVAGLTSRRMLTWTLAELWRRRLLTLVYLYAIWSGIRVVFYLVVPELRAAEKSPTDPLSIMVLPVWPQTSYWFIWALAIVTLLAWLLRRVPVPVRVTVFGVLAVASTTPGLLDFDNVGWDRVAQNTVFFLLAMSVSHLIRRLAVRVRIWHVVTLGTAYVALAIAAITLQAARVPGLVLLVSMVAVALGVAASTQLVRVRWLAFVSEVGRLSLPIYLLHIFVIVLALWPLVPLSSSPWLQSVSNVLPFLLTAVVVPATLLVHRLLRRVRWIWLPPRRARAAAVGAAVDHADAAPRATADAGEAQR